MQNFYKNNFKFLQKILLLTKIYSLKLFERFKLKVNTPDNKIYNALIDRCDDFYIANKLVSSMDEIGLSPDLKIFNCFMNTCENYTEASFVFDLLILNQHTPDEVTLNTWMKKCKDFKKAKRVFNNLIKTYQIEPNLISYSILIKESPSYVEGIKYFKLLESKASAKSYTH